MAVTQLKGEQVKDATITESDISLTDLTTLDVSTSAHGFAPKAPNITTKFLRGDATWAVPAGGSGISLGLAVATVGGLNLN